MFLLEILFRIFRGFFLLIYLEMKFKYFWLLGKVYGVFYFFFRYIINFELKII